MLCARPDSGAGLGQNYLPILEEAILKQPQPLRTLIESAGEEEFRWREEEALRQTLE